jgi:hypothetical protein
VTELAGRLVGRRASSKHSQKASDCSFDVLLQIQTQFRKQMPGMGRFTLGGAAEGTLIRDGSVTVQRYSDTRAPISVTVEDGVIVEDGCLSA